MLLLLNAMTCLHDMPNNSLRHASRWQSDEGADIQHTVKRASNCDGDNSARCACRLPLTRAEIYSKSDLRSRMRCCSAAMDILLRGEPPAESSTFCKRFMRSLQHRRRVSGREHAVTSCVTCGNRYWVHVIADNDIAHCQTGVGSVKCRAVATL